jgi:hemolysin III
MTPAADHYPDAAAERADLIVHVVGLAFALLGGAILVGLAFGLGPWLRGTSVLVYVAGMVAMLAASAGYNFAKARWRPLMRRFDQAGIFIMIAGSYTPFTTQRLHGAWAWGLTAVVWGLALLGVALSLLLRRLEQRFWIGLYLALGWVVLVAIKPMMDSLSWIALALLALGGLVYSAGAILYGLKMFKFRRAIWHGHVVSASVLHWMAVLVGVVLARGAG